MFAVIFIGGNLFLWIAEKILQYLQKLEPTKILGYMLVA